MQYGGNNYNRKVIEGRGLVAIYSWFIWINNCSVPYQLVAVMRPNGLCKLPTNVEEEDTKAKWQIFKTKRRELSCIVHSFIWRLATNISEVASSVAGLATIIRNVVSWKVGSRTDSSAFSSRNCESFTLFLAIITCRLSREHRLCAGTGWTPFAVGGEGYFLSEKWLAFS